MSLVCTKTHACSRACAWVNETGKSVRHHERSETSQRTFNAVDTHWRFKAIPKQSLLLHIIHRPHLSSQIFETIKSVINLFLYWLSNKYCLRAVFISPFTHLSQWPMFFPVFLHFLSVSCSTLLPWSVPVPVCVLMRVRACWAGHGWPGDRRCVWFGPGHRGASGAERSVCCDPGPALLWWRGSGTQPGGPLCLRSCKCESKTHQT